MSNSRRDFLKKSASLAALTAAGFGCAARQDAGTVQPGEEAVRQLTQNPNWPIGEGSNTPKLTMGGYGVPDEQRARKIKQLGVTHVIGGGGRNPWKKEDIQRQIDAWGEYGIKIADTYIGGFDKAVWGEEGRDEQIDALKESIRVAGEVGLPVLEYNWYPHRLTEGYYYVEGRGGAGYTGFDYDKVKDLPPEDGERALEAEESWDNYAYFLEEIVPVAEEAGVRLAVHPNDPPAAISRGSDEILVTFDHYKRLVNLVDSPANGMTCHPGYYAELGIDGLEVIRYLGERDRINHCHYRNVLVEEPSRKYVEVFPDNGQVDMFALMRELIRQGYTGAIHAEHARALDYDREHPEGIQGQYAEVGGGGYAGMAYNIAYTRAMLQAALLAEGKV